MDNALDKLREQWAAQGGYPKNAYEWRMYEYKKYLESPEWKKKRKLVLRRDDYICQSCLENKATQVHHKNYDGVDFNGSEPCFNLESVCDECHKKIHNKIQ